MKVYFISGLGADERVFRNIHLPPQYQVFHLGWIPPIKNETLKAYALRLAEKIDHSEKFALVGLSLGGMVATEIAKEFHPEKIVLISSIPLSSQMPFYFRWAGALYLHRVVPIWFIKKASRIKRLFAAETLQEKKMLIAMIDNSDPAFIRWAFEAALAWRNQEIPKHLIHIHGTADNVLPLRFTKAGYTIEKGDHLMILTRASKINALLKDIFN